MRARRREREWAPVPLGGLCVLHVVLVALVVGDEVDRLSLVGSKSSGVPFGS